MFGKYMYMIMQYVCAVSHSHSRVGAPGVELHGVHEDIEKINQILPFATEVRDRILKLCIHIHVCIITLSSSLSLSPSLSLPPSLPLSFFLPPSLPFSLSLSLLLPPQPSVITVCSNNMMYKWCMVQPETEDKPLQLVLDRAYKFQGGL